MFSCWCVQSRQITDKYAYQSSISTNHKHSLQQDGVNRRRHSWLPIKQLWDRLWSMPLLYGRLLHPRPALTNCKSCRTQHWELPQDAHKTQTYNICMTKHSHSPYTSTYSSTPHNTNRKHNIHHIPYTNTQHTSTLQGLKKPTIFNNGRYTTNIPTDPHTVTTTDIKTNMHHIHTSIVSMHLATRGNNKILRTPPPHTSISEEILPRLTHRTLAQLRTNKSPFLKSYLHKVDA